MVVLVLLLMLLLQLVVMIWVLTVTGFPTGNDVTDTDVDTGLLVAATASAVMIFSVKISHTSVDRFDTPAVAATAARLCLPRLCLKRNRARFNATE